MQEGDNYSRDMFSWKSSLGRIKSSCEICACRLQAGWEISSLRSKINWGFFFSRSRTHESLIAVLCIAFIALPYLALTHTPSTLRPFYKSPLSQKFRSFFRMDHSDSKHGQSSEPLLLEVLEKASMPNKTVIITTLNAAWAQNNSMIDLFLESFHHGIDTERLLSHLIIVGLDEKAYNRCVEIHPHCYKLKTQGVDFSGEKAFMTADYLKMMWRRILFLKNVLKNGYSFVFSDADILWFRNPFPHFVRDKDFQIACDEFYGNPTDLNNRPNGGFLYARANDRMTKFYDYWYSSRKSHPNRHDQDVLNDIKFEKRFRDIGVKIRFLDTQFFGGFCSIWRSNFDKVTTMHANCCKGLKAKLEDLRPIFDGWKQYRSNDTSIHPSSHMRDPVACPKSMH